MRVFGQSLRVPLQRLIPQPRRWISFLSPLALVLLWEYAILRGWLDRRTIPQPSAVLQALIDMSKSGELWNNVGISILRITLGFGLGALIGVLLGLFIGISPTFSALLRPLMNAINPIPRIALIPFVILAFGFTERGRVLAMALSVVPIVLLDTAAAVARIDPKYFEVARTFRASRWDVFWTVAFPASMPSIVNTLKLGLAFSLSLIVGVEIFGAQDGIGKAIWDYGQLYAVNKLGASIVAVAVAGWGINVLIDSITPGFLPWLPRAPETAPRGEEGPLQRTIRVWWRAARPFSYTAATVPVLLGSAIAAYQGYFNLLYVILALVGAVAMQAGTNLINDYYDHIKGADNPSSLGVGGAIQRKELAPRQVFWGGIAAFALASIIGLYFVANTGPFILILGGLSVLAGFFYTAGPAALAYIGLGELTVFVFMGPVIVIGAYYVQTQHIRWETLLASLPVGFLVAAILHANNLRDLESDRSIGKRTMATLLGRQRANLEYYVLVGGTYLSLLVMVLLNLSPWYTLVACLTLPMGLALMRRVAVNTEPAALNPVLRKTAQLHMRFGMLLVAGWVLALFINQLGGR